MAAGKTRRKPRSASRKPARKPLPKPKRAARPPKPARRPAATPQKAPNGRSVGTGIGLNFHHMDFTSHDLEAMKRFYAETLGFTNVVVDPKAGYMTVFVTPNSSVGFMPPMGGAPDQWRPPGEPAFYFVVDDVDEAYRKLTARGVSFEQEPRDMPWGDRIAILKDPEGRGVCLAQRLGK